MEKASDTWLAKKPERRTVPLPTPNRESYYWVEPENIVDYESGAIQQRSIVSVRLRKSRRDPVMLERLDIGADLKWIDQRMTEATFWLIGRL